MKTTFWGKMSTVAFIRIKVNLRTEFHIIGQRANRYVVAFHIAVSYDIYWVSPAASRPYVATSAIQSSVQCHPPPR